MLERRLQSSLLFVLALAGCGGSDAGATKETDAGALADDGGVATDTCDGGGADASNCAVIAGELDGLRWELPCTGPHDDTDACPSLTEPAVTSTTMAGRPGVVYDVVLRFRGVVEQRTYLGGTQDGSFYEGGDAPWRSDPFNVYGLTISLPAQQYYLNAGTSYVRHCFAVEYRETVQVAAGATVTLTADDDEGTSIINVDAAGNPIVVPGIPPAPAAFDGQFLQIDVISVTPH